MKIYLSDKDKKISGVCGGIAEAYHLDATLVRICLLILALLTGVFPTLLAYLVAAMIIPNKPHGNEQAQ
jgi:phage shock protein C